MIKGFEGVHVKRRKLCCSLLCGFLFVWSVPLPPPPLFFNLEYFLQQKRPAYQDFSCLVACEIFKLLFFNWPRILTVKARGRGLVLCGAGAQGPIIVQHLFLSYLYCGVWAQEHRGPPSPDLGLMSPETCHDAPALALEHPVLHFSSQFSVYRH